MPAGTGGCCSVQLVAASAVPGTRSVAAMATVINASFAHP
jgi:hypothetical protein